MKTTYPTSTPTREPATTASPLALGLWMRGSISGAALALAGITSLLSQPRTVSVLMALTWIAAGATFSWLSWQRASVHLNGVQGDERRDTASARPAADFVLTRQDA